MQYAFLVAVALAFGQPEALGAGDYERTLTVDSLKRTHLVHVSAKYDPKKPAPLVLALHGAAMTGKLMEFFTGLNKTSDEHGFIVVYPNGTGAIPTWNAGLFPGELNKFQKADDVKYLGKVLDDVESVLKIDRKRIYVTGMSNGAMMSYRLASEMSDRIAAIAPVAGTMALEKYEPRRPVPVLHFHGTKDPLVPFDGPDKKKDPLKLLRFRSVDDSIQACVKANACAEQPVENEIEVKEDKLKIKRKVYAGKNNADVVLYTIENGGHTWPGSALSPPFLGLSTKNFNANDVIWEFFRGYALK